MATGSLITNDGKKTSLYRTYTKTSSLSATLYTAPAQFKVGINGTTPIITDTTLATQIPIDNGTVNDNGDNTMTGSSGGDNSTDNTTTFKQGAGASDATAQNLIANDTNATKIWTITDLTSAGANCVSTKYIGLWLYIKDTTTLAKFLSAGTCLEIRIGADTTTNYYSQVYTAAVLAVGWNWLSDNALLSTWTVNGTPGTLNDFAIRITTNNATDTFIAGDVIYDLLRQWEIADVYKNISTGYPSLNYANIESTTRCYLNSLEANGFLVDSIGILNEDTTPLMLSQDNTGGDSKSDTDEFAFVDVDRYL